MISMDRQDTLEFITAASGCSYMPAGCSEYLEYVMPFLPREGASGPVARVDNSRSVLALPLRAPTLHTEYGE